MRTKLTGPTSCGYIESSRRSGVTLIEMLMVVTIITILMSMGFVMFAMSVDFTDRLQAKVAGTVARSKTAVAAAKVAKVGPALLTDREIVVFNDSVTDVQAEVNRLSSTLNMQVVRVFSTALKGMAIRTDAAGLMKLRTDPAVAYVQTARQFKAVTQTVPAGIRRINAPFNKTPAQISGPVAIGGPINLSPNPFPAKKPVAVLDTGIDGTHPDLNVVLTANFSFEPNNPNDVDGHGTHVSGTIGAKNNSIGVVGVNPGVPLWAVKVLDSFGFGDESTVLAGMEFVAQNAGKVRVINMSLGGPFSQPVNDAVGRLVRLGVVVCVAAGNDGLPADFFSPSSAPEAITVAAMCDTDGKPGGLGPAGEFGDPDDTMTIFSNFGNLIKFIAPGESVLSTLPGNSYGIKSGTSQATPHVTGVVSLILEDFAITPNPAGPINLPSVQPGVTPTHPIALSVSEQVQQKMKGIMPAEFIPGILGDPLSYRMLNAKGF